MINFIKQSLIPDLFAIKTAEQSNYLCGGKMNEAQNKKKVFSPISVYDDKGNLTHPYLGYYPDMTPEEALQVLSEAKKAYANGEGVWPTMKTEQRIECIEKFTFMMQDNKKDIVTMLMWEIGKSYIDSEKEFDRTIQYIKDTIDSLKDLDRVSSRFIISQGIIGQIRRSPFGVVLCMGPFNYPLNETFTILIPALIMGNTAVFKPPKQGILLFYHLLKAFQMCFPEGVVNTIYGEGPVIIPPIMRTGDVNVLAFIGTSKVSALIRKEHPKPHRLRCVLGLDAKNPGIILDDADIELAVNECIQGSLSFNGQRCTALKILFVHESIVKNFINSFTNRLDGITIGMPWDNPMITPLAEQNKPEYLKMLIDDAAAKGASIVNKNGGNCQDLLFHPALLYPVTKSMKIYYEEQFGPVIPVVKFSDIKEVIEYVSESNFGQQVSIFSNNIHNISKLVDKLTNQVSRVNINSQCQRGPDIFPFTGRKDSAEGTLSVSDALRVFSIRTLVAAKENQNNKNILKTIVQERTSNFISTDFVF